MADHLDIFFAYSGAFGTTSSGSDTFYVAGSAAGKFGSSLGTNFGVI